MKFRLLLLILLLGALSVAGTEAQQPDEWRAYIYDYDANQLITITENDTRVTPMPYPQPAESYLRQAVSPSGRYVIAQLSQPDAIIADLNTGNCCTPIQNPPAGQGPPVEWTFGPVFSPDETQAAMSFIDLNNVSTDNPPLGGTVVIDLASGQVVELLYASEVDANGSTLGLTDWDAEGIGVYPSCWACEPPISGLANIWDPSTGIVNPPSEYFNFAFGDWLSTGEFLITFQDVRFPIAMEPGYFPPANVVNYFTAGTLPDDSNAQTVYFNPDNLNLPTARWVLGGQGFLLHASFSAQDDPGVVVLRDGTQLNAGILPDDRVLAGMPQGWLAGDENGNISRYVYNPNNNLFERAPAAQLSPNPRLMSATPIGQNGLPPFAVNITPPPAPQCTGFMPSRLQPGMTAQVTPGPANNFRDAPGLSSTQLGQIPGEGVFFVLDGPVCADNMAWWQVDYQGTVGWTSEGQDNTYWLQPLP